MSSSLVSTFLRFILSSLMAAVFSSAAVAQYMTLSNGSQVPVNNVPADTSVSYTFEIGNDGAVIPPLPDGADGTVETRIRISTSGQTKPASGAAFTSASCTPDLTLTDLWRCNDLAIGQSQVVTFTWVEPDPGIREVVFWGSWNFVPPDETTGGDSEPVLMGFDSFIAYEQKQTVGDTLRFDGSLGPSSTEGLIGFDWDDFGVTNAMDEDENLFGQEGLGKTGVKISLLSSGYFGLGVSLKRTGVSFNSQVPVEITLELPENSVVAPEEKFTISSNWSTPNFDGEPLSGAWFETTNPGSLDFDLRLLTDLIFVIETEGCWLGVCELGSFNFGELLGFTTNGGLFSISFDFFNWAVDEIRTGVDRMRIEDQTLETFFSQTWEPLVPDPLPIDVLSYVKGDFSGLSSIGLGTKYDGVQTKSKFATTGVPRGRSISNGWLENAVELDMDLTNIIPIAAGFACSCFIPLFNGTLGDLVGIAAAKADPSGKTALALKALGFLGGFLLKYNIIELDVKGKFDANNLFRLTPRAPQIMILNGDDPVTPWYSAGDDISLVMPADTSDMWVEVSVNPRFSSELRVLAQDSVVNFSSGEISFAGVAQAGPGYTTEITKGGQSYVLSSDLQHASFEAKTFKKQIIFPDKLSEPRVSISGGGGISFGGQDSCWQPDNLPPDTPSGIHFDEDDGCVVSFRDFVFNGELSLSAFSNTNIALTLQNSTMSGQGNQLANIVLNPQSGTSMQLRGETRRPGLNQVDFFFDDARSSGNLNQIIVDTLNGAFISNSIFRGLTSNENQSDILLRNGRLWIENTTMELDNLTVENGAISLQDSEAELRNLQLGGTAESAMRLTRDSLITTNSNVSFNTSNLEIGNGSLVNVSGLLANSGMIDLEPGGWLTVLRGDNPDYADRLSGGNGAEPGVVNIVGQGDITNAFAALAMVPDTTINPVLLFNDQVRGSRLDTGVLLLSNGEIEYSQINNAGGTVITSGGSILDSTIALSDGGIMVVAHEPLRFLNGFLHGTGSIDIGPTGTLNLEITQIGDAADPPYSLTVNNRGLLTVSNTASITGNSQVVNNGLVQIDPFQILNVSYLYQRGGATDIDGTINSTEPLDFSAGVLDGSGQVNGSVINRNATVKANGLTISGDYTQLDSGRLVLDLSTNPTPVLNTGTAVVDGRLTIIVTQSYLDALTGSSSFDFMNYDRISGAFSSVEIFLDNGTTVINYAAEVTYGANMASVQWSEVPLIDLGELPMFINGFEF